MIRTRIGELRDILTIEKPPELDAAGSVSQGVWPEFGIIHAKVKPLHGRELMTAKAIYAEVTTQINTHYMPGLTPDMRLRLGDRLFNIIAIVDLDNRNLEYEIMCREQIT